jgi:hypothetical protein
MSTVITSEYQSPGLWFNAVLPVLSTHDGVDYAIDQEACHMAHTIGDVSRCHLNPAVALGRSPQPGGALYRFVTPGKGVTEPGY